MANGRRLRASPIFVLTCARSGSTLLRYLLDSHPELVCPPELNISQMCAEIERTWAGATDAVTEAERRREGTRAARDAARAIMSWWCELKGKQRFVDKSLTTVDQADVVARSFPEAQFITLYRHALDVVVSGIDASRWGFTAYGFPLYTRHGSNNHVAALVDYWCDRVTNSLAFEARHAGQCYRVYYERMVSEPHDVLPGLLAFLNLDWNPALLKEALAVSRDAGPADYEVGLSEAVSARSVGCGSTVPVGLISLPQRQRMNGLLAQLGYPVVTDDWNRHASPLLVDLPVGRLSDHQVGVLFEQRARESLRTLTGTTPEDMPRSLRVTVEASPYRDIWLIDVDRRAVHHGDGVAAVDVVISATLLANIARGEWSPGEAVNKGELRMAVNGGNVPVREVALALRMLLGPSSSVSASAPISENGEMSEVTRVPEVGGQSDRERLTVTDP